MSKINRIINRLKEKLRATEVLIQFYLQENDLKLAVKAKEEIDNIKSEIELMTDLDNSLCSYCTDLIKND